jgi:hypothetical protein
VYEALRYLRRVAEGVVVRDGIDGGILVEVVRAEAKRYVPSELDVVNAHLRQHADTYTGINVSHLHLKVGAQ